MKLKLQNLISPSNIEDLYFPSYVHFDLARDILHKQFNATWHDGRPLTDDLDEDPGWTKRGTLFIVAHYHPGLCFCFSSVQMTKVNYRKFFHVAYDYDEDSNEGDKDTEAHVCEAVNVGFQHIVMACKVCGKDM